MCSAGNLGCSGSYFEPVSSPEEVGPKPASCLALLCFFGTEYLELEKQTPKVYLSKDFSSIDHQMPNDFNPGPAFTTTLLVWTTGHPGSEYSRQQVWTFKRTKLPGSSLPVNPSRSCPVCAKEGRGSMFSKWCSIIVEVIRVFRPRTDAAEQGSSAVQRIPRSTTLPAFFVQGLKQTSMDWVGKFCRF